MQVLRELAKRLANSAKLSVCRDLQVMLGRVLPKDLCACPPKRDSSDPMWNPRADYCGCLPIALGFDALLEIEGPTDSILEPTVLHTEPPPPRSNDAELQSGAAVVASPTLLTRQQHSYWDLLRSVGVLVCTEVATTREQALAACGKFDEAQELLRSSVDSGARNGLESQIQRRDETRVTAIRALESWAQAASRAQATRTSRSSIGAKRVWAMIRPGPLVGTSPCGDVRPYFRETMKNIKKISKTCESA